MEKPTVYIESSIIGYLASRPSKNPLIAAHQQLTRDWWQKQKPFFAVFISQIVLREASAGDAEAARERLVFLRDIPRIAVTDEAIHLAEHLLLDKALPAKAREDALHIAVAAIHGMRWLLTWNCTHIANAVMRPVIEKVITSEGYQTPVICTPEELFFSPTHQG